MEGEGQEREGIKDSKGRIGDGMVRVGGKTEWDDAFLLYFPL
jgi:hypothetical protein